MLELISFSSDFSDLFTKVDSVDGHHVVLFVPSFIIVVYFPLTLVTSSMHRLLPPSVTFTLLLVSLQVSTKEAVFGSIIFQKITTMIQTAQSTSYVSHCNLFNLQTLQPFIASFASSSSDGVVIGLLNVS